LKEDNPGSKSIKGDKYSTGCGVYFEI